MRLKLSKRQSRNGSAGASGRIMAIALAAIVGLALAAALVLRHPETVSSAAPPAAEPAREAPVPKSVMPRPTGGSEEVSTQATSAAETVKPAEPANPPGASPASRLLPRGEPSLAARQAVTALAQIDVSTGAITPAQAVVWKESLRALMEQGESAVPAIREFLEKNLDLNFASLENGAAMGTSTLRVALLKAMQEIGGDQAIAGSLQALQTSADPTELALVAAYLQKADPAQYRDSVLAAAHEALNMAAGGKWDGRDVAPLFDVLKTFGGEEAARDLERYANTWFNYTPLVLAELPDGAGIASLIRLNGDGAVSLGKETYQRMLAQVSLQSPDAAAALVQLAQAGKIDPTSWRSVADALSGITLQLTQAPLSGAAGLNPTAKSYHVAIGNQNFLERPAPADMPPEQVAQRIQLIDRLLGVTSNPSAVTYLQQARSNLAARP